MSLHLQTVDSLRAEVDRARGEGLADLCLAAERAAELPRGLLLAIASRETHCRNLVGDGGHGRGVFQIDDRSHGAWLRRQGADGPGRMPPIPAAAAYAGQLLRDNLAFGRGKGLGGDALLKFAVSAYNAGAGGAWRGLQESGDSDARTANRNYGRDVLERRRLIDGWLGGDGTARPTLRQGARGRDVLELKRLLRAWAAANPGTRLPAFKDNDAYGVGAKAAVQAFQRASGLDPDGVVGKDTWGALVRTGPPDGT